MGLWYLYIQEVLPLRVLVLVERIVQLGVHDGRDGCVDEKGGLRANFLVPKRHRRSEIIGRRGGSCSGSGGQVGVCSTNCR